MALEATYSKYKKQNFLILIAICLALAGWCAYDGYFNQNWIDEHTDSDGNPEEYLVINRKAPPYLIGAALLVGIGLLLVKNKKVIAGESELSIDNKVEISYDTIQKIDKTHYDKKAFFVITYKNDSGEETDFKISNKKYDNLKPVLEHIVAKIS